MTHLNWHVSPIRLGVGVFIAATVGCRPEPREAARPAAYVEIFRLAQENMIRHERPRIFCLTRDQSGAPAEDSSIVAAVQRVEPRARPRESCMGTLAGDPAATIALRPSPSQYLVWLKDVAYPNPNRAVFDGGYWASGELAAEWRCTLRRDKSEWRLVEACSIRWFS